MVQSTTGTLIRPPANNPSKSLIENALELTPLTDIGPDIFTNTRPLWHPPGARGIYGGAAIAQSLAAAQATIPPPSPANNHASFLVHSMHCYFVLAGDSSIPVLYHVERVREGKSFMTRTVQARQRGRCIFTTTLSFVREGSAGAEVVQHEVGLPAGAEDELAAIQREEVREESEETRRMKEGLGEESRGPFESRRMEVFNGSSPHPHTKRTHQWLRARGAISSHGPQAHLSALAYMSDSYFIGTVSRVHGLWRFGRPATRKAMDAWDKSLGPDKKNQVPPSSSSSAPIKSAIETAANPTSPSQPNPYANAFFTSRSKASTNAKETASSPASSNSNSNSRSSYGPHIEMSSLEARENDQGSSKTIGMMVSLDHTVYFHRPRDVRADEWLFSEMESPWSGDGRGLVTQRIWSREGRLLATCVQEGLVRLVQSEKGVVERGKL